MAFRILLLMVAGLISVYCTAQVKWSFSAKKTSDQIWEIHLTAIIEEPWRIYSQSSPEGGPLPTKITFSKNPVFTFAGSIEEHGNLKVYHDQTFGVDVYSYSGKVDFVQVIKIKTANVRTTLTGTVEFMTCTNEKCMPPEKRKFSIKLE